MPPIIKNLFAFFTEIWYHGDKGYDTPLNPVHVPANREMPAPLPSPAAFRNAMHCQGAMPLSPDAVQSVVRGMHTIRTRRGTGPRPEPEQHLNCFAFPALNFVPPKWQRRDEIKSRLGAPLSFFIIYLG